MKYKYVVTEVFVPEWCTGILTTKQVFDELDDAMECASELNEDYENDDRWFDVIVQLCN